MTLSAGIRRPLVAVTINTKLANLGLAPIDQRLALVGNSLAAGTSSDLVPEQILDGNQADDSFGTGSELALMCRAALNGARDYQATAEIWAVGIADVAGTARVNTMTIGAGTATESAELVAKIAGREIRALVALGDDETDAAASLAAAINEASPLLPVTATSALGVVTVTHRQTGVNANATIFEALKTVAGLGTFTTAQTVAGVGAVDITAALDTLTGKDYDFIASANHAAADGTDFAAHLTAMWDPAQKRWRHSVMAETGSLATATGLSNGIDSEDQIVISAENYKNTPGEIAAYVAAQFAAEEDPNLPWNNVELPGLYAPDAADVPTAAEIETAIAAGCTILSANDKGSRSTIVSARTTKTTQDAVANYTLAELGITRALIVTARQVDAAVRSAYPRAKKSESVKRGVEGVTLRVLRLLESLTILQNVEAHAAEVIASDSVTNIDRINLAVPASVVPGFNQADISINLILE